MKTARGRGSSESSTALGPGRNRVGVDAAGHPDHPGVGDPQLAPLPLDVGRDRREGRVGQDDPAEQARSAGAPQLVGLAVVTRAGRLDERRHADGAGAGPAPSPPPPTAPGACGSRRSRRAGAARPRITPATKLRPKNGPTDRVLTHRWMKTP